MSLSVGDRVVITGQHEEPGAGRLSDLIGVVRTIRNGQAGVEFEGIIFGHNLDGILDGPRGWWVPVQSVIKMMPIKDVVRSWKDNDE